MSMKEFPVWMEGYAATGESARASFLGKYQGETFEDACQAWADEDVKRKELFKREDTVIQGKGDKTKIRPSYWGCRLYETEEEARASFG